MKAIPINLLFVTALFCLFSIPLAVQAAVNYTVTPRVIDVESEARDLLERTITITSDVNHVVRIFPSVNEIGLAEGGDIKEFKGPTSVDRPTTITAWLEISRAEIRLNPGEVREIPLTIRMHPNTEPGEYHAVLGFGYGRNRIEAEEQVKNGKAPSIVVTVRVPDKRVEYVDLEGFMVDKYVTSNENEAVVYTLQNPGDTTVVPTGEVIVYNTKGNEITSIEANPDKLPLAPGEELQLTANLPISGMMGRHKAFLNLRYGTNQSAAVYDTVFFYVLPWKFLMAIFGLISLIAIVLTLYLHRRFGMAEGDDEDGHSIDFHFRDGTSDDQDHDINLKQK